jgi:hypothetical protein
VCEDASGSKQSQEVGLSKSIRLLLSVVRGQDDKFSTIRIYLEDEVNRKRAGGRSEAEMVK